MPHNIRSTKFSGETRASFFGNSINGIQKKYVHSTRSQVFLSTSLVRAVILSITSRAGLVNVPYCTSLISFLILSSIASSFINLFISKCSSFFNIATISLHAPTSMGYKYHLHFLIRATIGNIVVANFFTRIYVEFSLDKFENWSIFSLWEQHQSIDNSSV